MNYADLFRVTLPETMLEIAARLLQRFDELDSDIENAIEDASVSDPERDAVIAAGRPSSRPRQR